MSYNKIMAYKVEYNGLRFLNNPTTIEDWGSLVLKEFSFFEVATQSKTEKYAIQHWEYVSPTMMKNRRIRMLFDIIAHNETERRALLKRVQRAFTPEQNPSPFNERLWKNLSFLDVDCKEWNCKCQVLQGIQLSDFANEKRAGISVELITDSPYFTSSQEYTLTTRNTLMWVKLPVKLPCKWQYYKWAITYNGVANSPLRITLNILDTDSSCYPFNKIKILHQTADVLESFHLTNISSLELEVWNKIIIDTEKRRAYLENNSWTTEITGLVDLWSIRPNLENWANIIAIDTGVYDECVEAVIKRNDLF